MFSKLGPLKWVDFDSYTCFKTFPKSTQLIGFTSFASQPHSNDRWVLVKEPSQQFDLIAIREIFSRASNKA
jgi:hypothetical protein